MFQGQEVRLALRSLRKSPVFSAVVILTLALGIGATTTLFTIVNAVLLRPLPFPDAERIVSVSESVKGDDRGVATGSSYFEWRESAKSFSSIALYGSTAAVLTGAGEPAQIDGGYVSSDFFSVLGATPFLGRVFRAEEDVPGAERVVILSRKLWRSNFGSDSGVVGRSITLGGNPYTAVGVLDETKAIPRRAQYWIPRKLERPTGGMMWFVSIIGRLNPGVTVETARAELLAGLKRTETAATPTGEAATRSVVVMTWHERRFGTARPALLILLGAVGFLLLIACANVANLMLARSAARERELAVRAALGASRWRIARQLLTESLLLSAAGGAIGLLVPLWSVDALVKLSPVSVANVQDIQVSGSVLAFAALVSIATGLVFGLLPAFSSGRFDHLVALKDGGTRTTSSLRNLRLRNSLVVLEVAMALLLTTGAGLLTRSLAKAASVEPGINPDGLMTATLNPSRKR